MLHRVTAGADDFNGDLMALCAEQIGDVVGLPEGKLRSAGADFQKTGISH